MSTRAQWALRTILALGMVAPLACAAPGPEPASGLDTSTGDPDPEPDTDMTPPDAGEEGDQVAPTVEILSPGDGTVVGGLVEIEVEADDDMALERVEVRIDGDSIGVLTEAPYVVTWKAAADPVAEVEITATAIDAAGNEAEDAVFVDNFASGGSGGEAPGNVDRSTQINGVSRDYFLYVPTGYDPSEPIPLLTLHHGAGGPTYKGEYYRNYWTQTAEAQGFILLSQDSLDDVNGGWQPADRDFWTQEVTETMAAYNIDRNRLYVWGYSAGGHFAHYLGMTLSAHITAYAVHSGTLGPFKVLGQPALIERQIPVGIWVGSTDPNGPSCEKSRDTFIAAGWVLGERLAFTEFPGGHEAPQNQMPDVWDFVSQWRLVE